MNFAVATLITCSVADMSSIGFGVVLPELKYNFHLTSLVWCSYQLLLHVRRHVQYAWQVICGAKPPL